MQSIAQSSFYPISLDEIKAKVAKKNGRRNGLSNGKIQQVNLFNNQPLDNVKEIINEFGEKIIRVDGEIPVDLPVKDKARFLFISYDQSILSHGLHKYPAKFFPELPRWLIKRYSKEGDLILDPFSGSDTTNIEALLSKRHSIGIDVDPFSRYLSKVKITLLDEKELQTAQKYLWLLPKIKGSIREIETIATGYGINNLNRLNKIYGKANWRKMKGICQVELEDGAVLEAEVHWYEGHGIGKKEIKIKKYL